MKKLIMLGSGGHAQALLSSKLVYHIDGLVSFEKETNLPFKILGNDDILIGKEQQYKLINGIGSVEIMGPRKRVYEKFSKQGFEFVGYNQEDSKFNGTGIQILKGAIIQDGVSIGENTIINNQAILSHGTSIGKHCHIAPGAVLSGGVTVGDCTHVGAGSIIIQCVKIGRYVTIGAGSIIIKDIPDFHRVIGNPARQIGLN